MPLKQGLGVPLPAALPAAAAPPRLPGGWHGGDSARQLRPAAASSLWHPEGALEARPGSYCEALNGVPGHIVRAAGCVDALLPSLLCLGLPKELFPKDFYSFLFGKRFPRRLGSLSFPVSFNGLRSEGASHATAGALRPPPLVQSRLRAVAKRS